MSTLTLASLTPSDMNTIIRKINKNESSTTLLYDADMPHAVADYIDRGIILGAFSGDHLVGQCVLIHTRPFTYELVNIAVDEKCRTKGIGRALIERCVEESKTAGFHTLEVGTADIGTDEIYFYLKCGFNITWVDDGFFIRNCPEPVMDNGRQCRDMVRFAMHF
mgnify:FL=1